jgi:hypothetical protein
MIPLQLTRKPRPQQLLWLVAVSVLQWQRGSSQTLMQHLLLTQQQQQQQQQQDLMLLVCCQQG